MTIVRNADPCRSEQHDTKRGVFAALNRKLDQFSNPTESEEGVDEHGESTLCTRLIVYACGEDATTAVLLVRVDKAVRWEKRVKIWERNECRSMLERERTAAEYM